MRTNLSAPTPAVQQPPQRKAWYGRGNYGYRRPYVPQPKLTAPVLLESEEFGNYQLMFPSNPGPETCSKLLTAGWRFYKNPARWVNKRNSKTPEDLAFAKERMAEWRAPQTQQATPSSPPSEAVATGTPQEPTEAPKEAVAAIAVPA